MRIIAKILEMIIIFGLLGLAGYMLFIFYMTTAAVPPSTAQQSGLSSEPVAPGTHSTRAPAPPPAADPAPAATESATTEPVAAP